MALCIGDLHGDIEKLKAFIKHKPEEEHIHVGDVCDDWTAPDKQIEDCIKLLFSKKAKVTNLVGNHEIPYMSYSPFCCSGFREKAENTFKLIRKHEKQMKMAMYVDGYVLSHAGVTSWFRKYDMNPNDVVKYIESQWQKWLNGDRNKGFWKEQDIFWISRISGGTSEHAGPIWARPGWDDIDKSYSQVFGHTERREPTCEYINEHTKVRHINLDCKKYVCYNTKTHQWEVFGHGLTTKEFDMFQRI